VKATTVRDWLDKLGSKTPAPGGGAVSALNGAIAAAQLKMVCEYSKDEGVNEKASLLEKKIEAFLILAEDDSEAFLKVREAYTNKSVEKIDSALLSAIQVSAGVIDGSEDLLSFCEANYQNFKRSLEADVITALANLRAAVSSAQAMEKTNMDSIKGPKPESMESYSSEIIGRIDKLAEKIKAGG
jgi:formiminotetrahydrofolate cyclodeaminase